jgi:Flp pilus assembly protein TadD
MTPIPVSRRALHRQIGTNAGRLAEISLWAAIVIAPNAGGSSSLSLLPVLALLAVVAYAASVAAARDGQRPIHFFGLTIGLAALACLTLLQAIPLPAGLLEIVSPRAYEIRELAARPDPVVASSISYETGATMREAAKLLLYALIASVAYERARVRRFEVVAIPVVFAGLAGVVLAAAHRLLDADRLVGVIEMMSPASKLITTFVNPNHAAGFMVLTCLVSLGAAIGSKRKSERFGFMVAAAASGAVAILTLSRGGLCALILGLLLLGGILWRTKSSARPSFARTALMLCLPLGGIAFISDSLQREFSDPTRLGIVEKLAAIRDAWPLVRDHPWLGIGRGAYVSVYPIYKTSALQLTFAYPENIAVQLVAEWGVLCGLVALGAFVFAVVWRLAHARRVIVIGALCGVLAVLVQNLVDFSLELAGMAIPIAAILGAAGAEVVRSFRVETNEPRWTFATAAIPIALTAACTLIALGLPDLTNDSDRLADAIKAQRPKGEVLEPLPSSEVDRIGLAHPANATIAAKAATWFARERPPDLKRAIHLANRALYLAPTYADAYLVTARLLLRAGHRAQAFGMYRKAWSLAAANRIWAYQREILHRAQSPEELLAAIPRKDAELDVIDEVHLARVVAALGGDRKAWASTLVKSVRLEGVETEQLKGYARAATAAGQTELAEQALRRLGSEVDVFESAQLLARLQLAKGERSEAKTTFDGAIAREGAPISLIRARIDLALQDGEVELARNLIEKLAQNLDVSDENQSAIAVYRAEVGMKEGKTTNALTFADRALQLTPHHVRTRMLRAEILSRIGRTAEARHDLEYVLRLEPQNVRAKHMLASIGKVETP